MSRTPFVWLPQRREPWAWRVAMGKTTQRGPKASLTVVRSFLLPSTRLEYCVAPAGLHSQVGTDDYMWSGSRKVLSFCIWNVFDSHSPFPWRWCKAFVNQHQKLGLFVSHDSYRGKGQSYGMVDVQGNHRCSFEPQKRPYFIFSSSNLSAKQTTCVMRKPFGGWKMRSSELELRAAAALGACGSEIPATQMLVPSSCWPS